MCLDIKKNSKIKIAKKPIIVYKLIEAYTPLHSSYTKLVSPYMGTAVKFDTEMPEVIIKIIGYFNCYVTKGYHSYVRIDDAYNQMARWNAVANGSHRVYKASIPVGSKYIKGTFNANFRSSCIASSRILITSEEMKPCSGQ